MEQVNQFPGISAGSPPIYWTTKLVTPPNIEFGSYQVVIRLELLENQLVRSLKNNRLKSNYIYHRLPPDLAIISFRHQPQGSLDSGQSIKTQTIYQNLGGYSVNDAVLKILLREQKPSKKQHVLHQTKLTKIPAISDQYVYSQVVNIPDLQRGIPYYLEATIDKPSSSDDARPQNNLMASEQTYQIDADPIPFYPVDFVFHTEKAYPGEPVGWGLRLFNESKKLLKRVQITLTLKDSKGAVQKWGNPYMVDLVIPPKNVSDVLEKTQLVEKHTVFPKMSPGTYQVIAKINWNSGKKMFFTTIRGTKTLVYQAPQRILESIFAENQILLPGHEFSLQLVVRNQGGSPTIQESMKVVLTGANTITIGTIQLPALRPRPQAYVLNRILKIPQNLPAGIYGIQLQTQTQKGKPERFRLSGMFRVSPIQILNPKPTDAFYANQVPTFQWKGTKDFQYRMCFSKDPKFKDNLTFQIPFGSWIPETSIQPEQGEWKIIWSLSKNLKTPIYWRLEAKNQEGKLLNSSPQKLKLIQTKG